MKQMNLKTTTGKWLALIALGTSLSMINSMSMAGTITGSVHDFSGKTYTGGQICVTCHTPHNADTSITDAPLWNHEVTSKSFAVYASSSLDASVGQPAGVSKLCLSCHDGSLGVDSFGATPPATPTDLLTGTKAVGADELNNDHPISFDYNAVATADPGIKASTTAVTIGTAKQKEGTIASLMLDGDGMLQCSSCHDVHNNYTANTNGSEYRLLKVSANGSAICLTCHDK